MNMCDHLAHHVRRLKNLECVVNKDRMNEVRRSHERNSMQIGKQGKLMNEVTIRESGYRPGCHSSIR